jgi:NAD(P)-dependent dehydrogenase (short-subunit alcohol dehydrogenase family)
MNDSTAITLVTGGGRGIGGAVAVRMARETPVLVVGRTQDSLEAVCGDIGHLGGTGVFCTGEWRTRRPPTERFGWSGNRGGWFAI